MVYKNALLRHQNRKTIENTSKAEHSGRNESEGLENKQRICWSPDCRARLSDLKRKDTVSSPGRKPTDSDPIAPTQRNSQRTRKNKALSKVQRSYYITIS